jgi:c-di-GMP-related signal transduction protein
MFSVVWLAQKYFSTVMKTNTKLVIKLIHPQIPPPKFLKKKKKKKKKKFKNKIADGAGMGQGDGRTIGLGS